MTSQGTRQIALLVGDNLRAARDARGLTQKDVAYALGAQPSDISRWERGTVEPGRKYRQALADYLFNGDLAALYAEPQREAA